MHVESESEDKDAFLSTPSARRATGAACRPDRRTGDFYPRPPRGGRLRFIIASTVSLSIFLSTPSARRATPRPSKTQGLRSISIHALREEGDGIRGQLAAGHNVISIHALREEGDVDVVRCAEFHGQFLSTPSARRATWAGSSWSSGILISIHALREEGDLCCLYCQQGKKISIHALREEGDSLPQPPCCCTMVFLSTPSARRATAKTERKHPAFVSLYTSLHKLQRDVCKPNRKITPLLAQTAGIPVRSVPENHVCCRFALAGHQKISTLSWANSGCSPTCSTLVW